LSFIGKVAGGILDVIGAVVRGIQTAVSGAIAAINTLIKAYNAIPLLPNIPTITAPSFASSAPKVTTTPTPTAPKITTPGTITTTPSTSGSSNTPIATAVTTPTISTTIIPSGNAIPNTFNPGGFRQGEEIGNVIINVNSPSVIDREGFTRAVVDALNDSYDRGTGGGSGLRGAVAL
jgi:hypothetical protein